MIAQGSAVTQSNKDASQKHSDKHHEFFEDVLGLGHELAFDKSKEFDYTQIPAYQRTNAKNALGMLLSQQYPASVQMAHFHSKVTMGPPGLRFIKSKATGIVEEVPYCPYTGRRIIRQDVSICCDTSLPWSIEEGQEKFRHSSGVSLFFETIKVLSLYLLLRLLVIDAYNMYASFYGSYCRDHLYLCTSFIGSYLSGYNNHAAEDSHYQTITQILHFVMTLLSVPFFAYCRLRYIRVSEFLDHMDVTDDDFSIMVQDIPPIIRDLNYQVHSQKENDLQGLYQRKDLDRNVEQYLEEYFANQLNKLMRREGLGQQALVEPVQTVTLAYDVSEFDNIDRLASSLINDMKEHKGPAEQYHRYYQHQFKLIRGDSSLEMTEEQKSRRQHELKRQELSHASRIFKMNTKYRMGRIEPTPSQGYIPQYLSYLGWIDKLGQNATKKYIHNDPELTLKNFKGTAFITFKNQKIRNMIVEEADANPEAFVINGQTVRVSEPSEPEDILWENLAFSHEQRQKIFYMNVMVLVMCLGFSFAICLTTEAIQISGNDFEQEKQAMIEDSDANFAQTTLEADLLNYGMILVTYIANYWLGWVIEKITVLERQKSTSQLVVSLVVRNVLAKFVNTCMVYLVLQLIFIETTDPLGPNGLVAKIFQIVILLGIIDAFINLVQPQRSFTYLLTLHEYKNRSFAPLTQEELNSELARPQFDIVDRYSFYIFNAYLAAFYGPFIPQLTPIFLITFFIQYWIDKFNMFKRNSFTMKLNYRLSLIAIKLSEYTLLLSSVGGIIFFYWIDVPGVDWSYWVFQTLGLIISVAYLALAHYDPSRIVQFFGFHQEGINMSYDQFKKEYVNINTFWSCNPATKRIGKLSAKAMREKQNINKSLKNIGFGAFERYDNQRQQCYRSLKSLFLPHQLEKYWDIEQLTEPYKQKYSHQEKKLYDRCFGNQKS